MTIPHCRSTAITSSTRSSESAPRSTNVDARHHRFLVVEAEVLADDLLDLLREGGHELAPFPAQSVPHSVEYSRNRSILAFLSFTHGRSGSSGDGPTLKPSNYIVPSRSANS